MEQLVDRGQADVLVHPAVTGDVVSVQQLVVVAQVGAGLRIEWLSVPRLRVGVSDELAGSVDDRHGVVRDVVEEGAADGDRRVVQPVECAVGGNRGGEIALQEALRHDVGGRVGELDDELRQAIRAADEIAVRVGGQQRHRAHVGIGDLDAEERRGVGLQVAPRRHGRPSGRRRCPRRRRRQGHDGSTARRSNAACRPRRSYIRAGTPGVTGPSYRSGSGRRMARSG